MYERQEIEQYFFDQPTLDHLAAFAARFSNPCCLCTPSLGEELEKRGVRATTLDLDERFDVADRCGVGGDHDVGLGDLGRDLFG